MYILEKLFFIGIYHMCLKFKYIDLNYNQSVNLNKQTYSNINCYHKYNLLKKY